MYSRLKTKNFRSLTFLKQLKIEKGLVHTLLLKRRVFLFRFRYNLSEKAPVSLELKMSGVAFHTLQTLFLLLYSVMLPLFDPFCCFFSFAIV